MNKRRSATPVAAQPTTPSFDPSTWANQPRLLAGNQAEAATVHCAAWAIGIVLAIAVVGVAAWQKVNADPVDVLIVVAVAVVIGCLVTLWRWATTYAAALQADTAEARRATWQREIDTDKDLTGDGYIGDPFNRVSVKREGETVAEVIVPRPSHSARHEPAMIGWGVTPSDLVAFVFEAEAGRGLNERAWVGEGVARFHLPSGAVVTQPLFRQVLAALAEHELDGRPMAAKEAQRWILKARAEAIARKMKP
jgi:hypothetical protein